MYTCESIYFDVSCYMKGSEKMGNASTRAKNKYNEKAYDRVSVVVPKGKKEDYTELAKKLGEKGLNGLICKLLDECERKNM